MSNEILIRGLNDDLAAELGTVIRYTHQAAKCYGLLAAELREFLVKEAQDELGHAAYLMDVIQDLARHAERITTLTWTRISSGWRSCASVRRPRAAGFASSSTMPSNCPGWMAASTRWSA